MSKKDLLNEGTIRRFMKLAAINENATSAFTRSLNEEGEEEDAELAMAADEADAELDDEAELEEPPAGDAEEAVKDMVDAVVGAISDVADDHGVAVDLDVEGGDEEAEMDMGAELGDEETALDDEAELGMEPEAELEAPLEDEEELALEARIREIVAEMMLGENEELEEGCADETVTESEETLEEDSETLEEGEGTLEEAEDTLEEAEDTLEEDEVAEVRNTRGDSATGERGRTSHGGTNVSESVQLVDDGILVQEVTNRVFERLQTMLKERKQQRK